MVSSVEIRDPIQQKVLTSLTRAVWDTGATNSVLSDSVAQRLGLPVTGQTRVHTANGSAVVNTYVIDLVLPHSNVIVLGLQVSAGALDPTTEMLIGMDVIMHGDFTVQNHQGKTHFSFAIPPFETKYNMVEKANKINARIAKRRP